jgi:hypothetical protein
MKEISAQEVNAWNPKPGESANDALSRLVTEAPMGCPFVNRVVCGKSINADKRTICSINNLPCVKP